MVNFGDSSQTTVINPSQSGYYSLNINYLEIIIVPDSIFIHVIKSAVLTLRDSKQLADSVVWNGLFLLTVLEYTMDLSTKLFRM